MRYRLILLILVHGLLAVNRQLTQTADRLGAVNLIDLLTVSIDAVEVGGNVLADVRNQKNMGVREKTGENDLVTFADEESNRQIVAIFRHVFPEIPIDHVRSEEVTEPTSDTPVEVTKVNQKRKRGVLQRLKIPVKIREEPELRAVRKRLEKLYFVAAEDVTIWIDPMDATKEYTQNLVNYTTVMIGVAVKGKPVIGVVRKPFTNETFWGIDWTGVISTVSAIPSKAIPWKQLRQNIEESKGKVIVSRSHPGDVVDRINAQSPQSYEIIPAGGSGYKSVEVLNGMVEAYVHTGWIKLWDLCAPNAILNAAGGALTDLKGNQINYNYDQNYKHVSGVIASLWSHEYWTMMGLGGEIERPKLVTKTPEVTETTTPLIPVAPPIDGDYPDGDYYY